MDREIPFNPDEAKFFGESDEQINQERKSEELIEQEKTDLAFKKTVNEFKDIAKNNPLTKGIKKIFGK